MAHFTCITCYIVCLYFNLFHDSISVPTSRVHLIVKIKKILVYSHLELHSCKTKGKLLSKSQKARSTPTFGLLCVCTSQTKRTPQSRTTSSSEMGQRGE